MPSPIEPRISIITLGVEDLERSVAFYHEGLGLPTESPTTSFVMFLTAGTRLALYPLADFVNEIPGRADPGRPGFGGVTLAYNVRARSEVDDVLALIPEFGGSVLKPATDTAWGGYSGYFGDPDGHLWEVAWGETWQFATDGTLWGGPLGDLPARR